LHQQSADASGDTYRSMVAGSMRASIRRRGITDAGTQRRNFHIWLSSANTNKAV
jgi:hypothetical protein